MSNNNRLLRAALDLPDGFDRFKHRKAIEDVARTHAHSVVYRSLVEESTCATHAFGLSKDATYRAVASSFGRKIFAGRAFMEWLLGTLREIDQPSPGCLALYFSGEIWQHVGVVSSSGRVVSQWGTFPVYEHRVFEIPSRYGDVVRYFEMPSRAETLRLFLEYAKTWSLSDRDIDRAVHLAGDH
jgi:hypothetical protein